MTIKEMLVCDGRSEQDAEEMATVVRSHLSQAMQTLAWDLEERHLFDMLDKEYPLALLVQKACACDDMIPERSSDAIC